MLIKRFTMCGIETLFIQKRFTMCGKETLLIQKRFAMCGKETLLIGLGISEAFLGENYERTRPLLSYFRFCNYG